MEHLWAKKIENTLVYKGIPFVERQPKGDLRWKAPANYVPDDSIYEAYYNAKGVAKVTLKKSALANLKVGSRVKIQATCLKDTVKKSLKVQK